MTSMLFRRRSWCSWHMESQSRAKVISVAAPGAYRRRCNETDLRRSIALIKSSDVYVGSMGIDLNISLMMLVEDVGVDGVVL